MRILALALLFLVVLADLPNLKQYFNFAINDAAVKAIKDSGAKWETYAPGENPLRNYNDEQLKYLMSMPGVDYDAYMKEMLSLGSKMKISSPSAKDGGKLRVGINEPVKGYSFPTTYDWRTSTDGIRCKPAVQNQGACGACYAFATASCITARTCIASAASGPVELSHQNILACNKRTTACNGGILDISFNYAEEYGIVPLSCQPYAESSTPDTQSTPSQACSATCTASGPYTRTFCKKGTSVLLYTKDRIKNEIYARGPVASSMTVWSDLTSYKSGIYKQSSGSRQGGHAILLVGWGLDSATSTNYWIVQNSWGADWGESGYFRIDITDANSAIGDIGYYCVPDV